MKTAVAIVVLVLCCRPGPAQTTAKEDQLSPNVRLYHPKNITEGRARQVAEFVNAVIGGGVRVDWNDVPQSLVIRGATPADVDAAEALLKRFDVPGTVDTPTVKRALVTESPELDCVVYLIRATTGPPRTDRPGPPTSPVPAELAGVIDEMKHSFAYDHYALWDMQVIHQGGGAGDFQGMLPRNPNEDPQMYAMSYKGYGYSYGSKAMQISEFQFSIKMRGMPDGFDSHIRTSVAIHEGQKLVLGKIRLLENADLFLILATKPR